MGLSEEELLALYFGGLFHDAGKGILTDFSGFESSGGPGLGGIMI